jgi:hypothetical protein
MRQLLRAGQFGFSSVEAPGRINDFEQALMLTTQCREPLRIPDGLRIR